MDQGQPTRGSRHFSITFSPIEIGGRASTKVFRNAGLNRDVKISEPLL